MFLTGLAVPVPPVSSFAAMSATEKMHGEHSKDECIREVRREMLAVVVEKVYPADNEKRNKNGDQGKKPALTKPSAKRKYGSAGFICAGFVHGLMIMLKISAGNIDQRIGQHASIDFYKRKHAAKATHMYSFISFFI